MKKRPSWPELRLADAVEEDDHAGLVEAAITGTRRCAGARRRSRGLDGAQGLADIVGHDC